VCRLHQPGQLIGRNHRYLFVAFAAHDYNFMVIGHAVKHRRQTLAQVGICGFDHKILPFTSGVQDSCTPVNDQSPATALGTGRAVMACQSRKTFGRMAAKAITAQTAVSIPATPSRKTAGTAITIRDTVNTMAKG
jgi:hypothetical protein